MHDYEIYEQGKNDLKNYLRRLDQKCISYFGPYNKHDYPVDNPYKSFADDVNFRKKILKNKSEKEYISNKTCKFLANGSRRMDKDERYYTHINTERECELEKGFWDPNAINRYNKYDKGTCWKNEQNKVCGSRLKNANLLRPYNRFDPNISKIIVDNTNHCEIDPNCNFQQQTAFTYDCLPKNKEVSKKDDDNRPYHIPPSDMPLDKFEQFLEDWYIHKKNGVFITSQN